MRNKKNSFVEIFYCFLLYTVKIYLIEVRILLTLNYRTNGIIF